MKLSSLHIYHNSGTYYDNGCAPGESSGNAQFILSDRSLLQCPLDEEDVSKIMAIVARKLADNIQKNFQDVNEQTVARSGSLALSHEEEFNA